MKYEENVWYGWNGGECPVHPLYKLIHFRVVKEHKEPVKPREFWVTPNGKLIPVGMLAAFGWTTEECFKVSEVME